MVNHCQREVITLFDQIRIDATLEDARGELFLGL